MIMVCIFSASCALWSICGMVMPFTVNDLGGECYVDESGIMYDDFFTNDGCVTGLRIYQNSNTVIHTNYVSYVQRAYQGTYNRCEYSSPSCGQRGVCLL